MDSEYSLTELRKLSYSSGAHDRLLAAQHPDTPREVLTRLTKDTHNATRIAASTHPELPTKTVRNILAVGDRAAAEAIVAKLTPETATKYKTALRKSRHRACQRYAAKHFPEDSSASASACPTPLKTRWASQEQALASAANRTRKTPTALSVYRCPCGGWHLTSKRKPRRK